jgi:hypothetical protein
MLDYLLADVKAFGISRDDRFFSSCVVHAPSPVNL